MRCCKTELLIASRNKLPSKKNQLYVFYFYVFEKEGLKTHFKHSGLIRIQTHQV